MAAVGVSLWVSGCADDSAGGQSEEGGSDGSTDSHGGDGTGPGVADGSDTGAADATGEDTSGDGDTDSDSDTDTTDTETGGAPIDWDPQAVPESLRLFPRTVMAGDMVVDAFVVAIYIADAAPKTLRVWQPAADGQQVVLVDEQTLEPDLDGFAKTRVEGLSSGTWYQYAVFDGEAPDFTDRSLIGDVKTALGIDQVEPVTIAFASCIGTGTPLPGFVDPDDPTPQQWPITDMAESLEFDLLVHLGDQAYMDTVWQKGADYEQYLAAWGAAHGGGYRKVYPKAGLLVTWDDHEVVDNGTVDPWTTDEGDQARILNAKQAWYRVMPIDAADPTTEPVWRGFQWGEVVEILILDTRYERTDEPSLSFMSDAQRQWLHDRLLNSPCRFVCVCTPKPYSDIKMLLGDYPGAEERWSGHPDDRQGIKDLVNDNDLSHVLWVTGDIHMSYVGVTDRDDESIAGNMTEVCLTSGNTNPLGEVLSPGQFEFNTSLPRMPVITFDPVSDEILIEMYDSSGTVTFDKTLSWA